jgi:hypothetical protein
MTYNILHKVHLTNQLITEFLVWVASGATSPAAARPAAIST